MVSFLASFLASIMLYINHPCSLLFFLAFFPPSSSHFLFLTLSSSQFLFLHVPFSPSTSPLSSLVFFFLPLSLSSSSQFFSSLLVSYLSPIFMPVTLFVPYRTHLSFPHLPCADVLFTQYCELNECSNNQKGCKITEPIQLSSGPHPGWTSQPSLILFIYFKIKMVEHKNTKEW